MKKRKLLIVVSLAMLLLMSVNVMAAEKDSGKVQIGQLVKQGDVDVDGDVDEDDLATLRKVLVGSDTRHMSSVANVNLDEASAVDVRDLIHLKKLITDSSGQ